MTNVNRVLQAFIFLIFMFPFTHSFAEDIDTYFAWRGGGGIYSSLLNADDSGAYFDADSRLIVNTQFNPKWKMNLEFLGEFVLSDEPLGRTTRNERWRYRSYDLNEYILNEDKLDFILSVDRFDMEFELPFGDLIIGRQPISSGEGFFWNILDVYYPFAPGSYTTAHKHGVDAIKLDMYHTISTGANVFMVFGRDKDDDYVSHYASSYMGRYFRGEDIGAYTYEFVGQGGKVYGAFYGGGGAYLSYDGFRLKGEVGYYSLEKNDDRQELPHDYGQALVGVGYDIENQFHFDLEYFRNGAGSTKPGTRLYLVSDGLMPNSSKDLLGVRFAFAFAPEALGQIAFMASLNDSSYHIAPELKYYVMDDMYMRLAFEYNKGKRPRIENDDVTGDEYTLYRSEFGSYPHAVYFSVNKHY